MADKDKNDNMDNNKMKEIELEKIAKKMLVEEYGYSKDQIKLDYKLPEAKEMFDIVVLAKKDNVIQKEILVVVEIKKGPLLLPLYQDLIEDAIISANAQYGMVYNGIDKLCVKQDLEDYETIRKLTDKKNFGELKIISDIPSAKKIKKSNIVQKTINLQNYADAKIKEIRRFLDDTLEIKSSHNFLIYFMLLAVEASHQDTKVNIFKLSDAFKEIRKIEQTYAIKSILEKHDEFKKVEKEYKIASKKLDDALKRLKPVLESIRYHLLQLAELYQLPESEYDFLEERIKKISKKGDETFHHFLGLFDLEPEELTALRNQMQNQPLPDSIQRHSALWSGLISISSGTLKNKKILLSFFPSELYHSIIYYLDVTLYDQLPFLPDIVRDFEFFNSRLRDVVVVGQHTLPFPNTGNESTEDSVSYKNMDSSHWHFHREKRDPLTFDNKHEVKIKKGGKMVNVIEDYGKYDAVIAMPPFAPRKQNELHNFILQMIERTNPGGMISLLVAPNFQFSQSAKETRKKIQETCNILGMIQLPQGYFKPNHMVGGCILLLEKKSAKKKQTKKVFVANIPAIEDIQAYDGIFIQTLLGFGLYASTVPGFLHDECKIPIVSLKPDTQIELTYSACDEKYLNDLFFEVDLNELRDSWTVGDKTPYFKTITEIPNAAKLSDVTELFSSTFNTNELTKLDERSGIKIDEEAIDVDYLRISDLSTNEIKSTIKEKRIVSKNNYQKKKNQFLEDDDIVISCRGTIGKAAIVETKGRLILPSPQLIVLRPDRKQIESHYLLHQLNSKSTQEQMMKSATGTYIPYISLESVKKIIITLLPKSEQKKVVKEYVRMLREIKELEDKLERKRKKLNEVSV